MYLLKFDALEGLLLFEDHGTLLATGCPGKAVRALELAWGRLAGCCGSQPTHLHGYTLLSRGAIRHPTQGRWVPFTIRLLHHDYRPLFLDNLDLLAASLF